MTGATAQAVGVEDLPGPSREVPRELPLALAGLGPESGAQTTTSRGAPLNSS